MQLVILSWDVIDLYFFFKKRGMKRWGNVEPRLTTGLSQIEAGWDNMSTHKNATHFYFADRKRSNQTASRLTRTLKRAPRLLTPMVSLGVGPPPIRGPASEKTFTSRRANSQPARYPAATRFSRPSLARASHFYALVSARCNPHRGSTLPC